MAASDPTGYAQLDDRGPMVRAARALLSSVTRVLLLADIVVVKQLLLAKDRVSSVAKCLRQLFTQNEKNNTVINFIILLPFRAFLI